METYESCFIGQDANQWNEDHPNEQFPTNHGTIHNLRLQGQDKKKSDKAKSV